MKVLILLGLMAAAYANMGVEKSAFSPNYSIIREHLIPLAEKIREAEESMSKGRIGHGNEVLNPIPHQVAVLNYFEDRGAGLCGGVILTPNRVLYAAHCWNDGHEQATGAEIVAGSTTVFSGGVRINAKDVIVHPEFNQTLISNDLAMIYLESDLPFSDIIGAATLPTSRDVDRTFSYFVGSISGFGVTQSGGVGSLHNTIVLIIENRTCKMGFPRPDLVRDTNICGFGTQGRRLCVGDAGGPMTLADGLLVGISSFSYGDCNEPSFSVFTRVTSYLSFINQHL